MASLLELHQGLKERLDTIPGLSSYANPASGNQSMGEAYMSLTDWTAATMGQPGVKLYRFELVVFTSETIRPQDGYGRLMEFANPIGTRSIPSAIFTGNSAGVFAGLSDTFAHVVDFRVLGVQEVDAFQKYGGVFTVEIRTIPS